MKSKFLKLNYSHVEYVINCLGKNTTVGQEDKIISMKIGFVHKNMLRGNPRTEKCNQLQKSYLKECIDMEIKREYYI